MVLEPNFKCINRMESVPMDAHAHTIIGHWQEQFKLTGLGKIKGLYNWDGAIYLVRETLTSSFIRKNQIIRPILNPPKFKKTMWKGIGQIQELHALGYSRATVSPTVENMCRRRPRRWVQAQHKVLVCKSLGMIG
jgi:hypothetical protein